MLRGVFRWILPLALTVPTFFVAHAQNLTSQTVALLKVAWTFETNAIPPNKPAAQIAAFEATPLFADGLVYVITPFDQVIALDPATGLQQWSYDPHIAGDRSYSEASARGVAVAG